MADSRSVEAFETFPGEPPSTWSLDDFRKLVLWATDRQMSDLTVISNDVAFVRIHGRWQPATKRPILSNQLFTILDWISNNKTASTTLKSTGIDLDFAYEIEPQRGVRLRYRGNAAAVADGYQTGVRIVLRAIPEEPPKVADLNLEQEILDNAFPNNGLVLFTGVMGSGKSTSIAGILRESIETQPRHVITYESPIEFDFTRIPNRKGPVSQSQVPNHISSFDLGIRNTTRSAADVVLIGESRDPETLSNMIQSAYTGVTAYSTVHTPSVPETMTRIINTFPPEQQLQIAASLVSALRLVVSQRLLPRADGQGRIALREYLAFTPTVRKVLFTTPLENIIPVTERLLFEYGQPLQKVATDYFQQGLISEMDYLAIMAERSQEKKKIEPSDHAFDGGEFKSLRTIVEAMQKASTDAIIKAVKAGFKAFMDAFSKPSTRD